MKELDQGSSNMCENGGNEEVSVTCEMNKHEVIQGNYTLDKQDALMKKLDSCNKQPLKYDIKADQLVITFSTAAFELARHEFWKF